MEKQPEIKSDPILEEFKKHQKFETALKSLTLEQKKIMLNNFLGMLKIEYEPYLKQFQDEFDGALQEELKNKPKSPYSPQFYNIVLQWSIYQCMDKIMECLCKSYEKLRNKIGDQKIEDYKTTMMFQMNLGLVVSELVQIILPEMKAMAEKEKLNEQELLQPAIMMLSSDLPRILELEEFLDPYMKSHREKKEVTNDQVKEFTKRSIEYLKLVDEGKIGKDILLLYPSMVVQYLYKEFEIEGSLANDIVLERLKGEIPEEEIDLYVEQVFYVIRMNQITEAVIMEMQAQFEQMEQMMGQQGQGYGQPSPQFVPPEIPGQLPGQMPGQLSGQFPGQSPFGDMDGGFPGMMDPGMMGMGMPGQGPNPEAMAQMMEAMQNLDIDKMMQMIPPELLQQMQEMAMAQQQNGGGFPGFPGFPPQ